MSDERDRLEAAHEASVQFVERILAEGPSIKPLVRETVEQHADYVMALARNWMTNGDVRHGEMLATMMLAAKWWAQDQAAPETREVHVIPAGDGIDHETSNECVCGPDPEFVTGGVVYTHHSLDNREAKEQS